MSTPVNIITEYCYYWDMRFPEISDWFNRAFITWQNGQTKRVSVTEFGEFLEKSQPTISAYLNGTRKPSFTSAISISKKLMDYTLLDILGYARPDPKPLPFESLPPELVSLLNSIDLEIEKTLRERGVSKNSPEAESVAREIVSKYGARFIAITNSGKPSN